MRTRRRPSEIVADFANAYASEAVRYAVVKELDTGELVASIPGFDGVWASADDREALMGELESVVRDWTLLKIEDGDRDLPVIPGVPVPPHMT
jgi:hypothetical protein